MTSGEIVVGLLESHSGRAALHWAASQARSTGSGLRAVHVLEWPVGLSAFELGEPGESVQLTLQHIDHAYGKAYADFLAEVDPLPEWQLQFDEGDVAEVLVLEAETADLLVVGTRQRSVGGRLQAGSLSHYCVAHAACPVVAVPVEYLTADPRPGTTAGQGSRQRR